MESVSCKVLLRQLIRLADQSPKGREDVKTIIRMIGKQISVEGLEKNLEDSIEELSSLSILPVIGVDSAVGYETTKGSFYIADNKRYAEAFEGKVKFLDFTYGELNSLHGFLDLLALQGRYLSKHVRSSTEAETPVPDEVLTEQMQQRSYALSWYVQPQLQAVIAVNISTVAQSSIAVHDTRISRTTFTRCSLTVQSQLRKTFAPV